MESAERDCDSPEVVRRIKTAIRRLWPEPVEESRSILHQLVRSYQDLVHRRRGIPGVPVPPPDLAAVLEPAPPSRIDDSQESSQERLNRKAELQYEMAQKLHPGEFVVMVDTEIVFHSPDRAEALALYERARVRSDGRYPVLVSPETPQAHHPVLRGRSTTRQ